MRMRKKKHGAERLSACGELFYDQGADTFDPARPLHLEIGCGKGAFICAMAAKYPDVNFIAVEKISDVLLLAMERAKREELKNLRFLNCDAAVLGEKLPPHSLTRIYLNFSDPWPKKGHTKRRLTYRTYLNLYRELLQISGLEITASGGIARMEELAELQAMGCHAAILGKSIYTGAIDLAKAVRLYEGE